jgi:hypothetical protein
LLTFCEQPLLQVETGFDSALHCARRSGRIGVRKEAGSGVEPTHNSATLYRYSTVAVHELFVQLANDAGAAAKAATACAILLLSLLVHSVLFLVNNTLEKTLNIPRRPV